MNSVRVTRRSTESLSASGKPGNRSFKIKNWRIFFGLPISAESKEALNRSLMEAHIHLPGRLVDLRDWHITLFFLGETPPEQAESLIKDFQQRRWTKRFSLSLEGLGAFPSEEHARILWCGTGEGKEKLSALAGAISERLRELGIPPDEKAFHGHVTLSRVKRAQNLSAILHTAFSPVRLQVERFVLFRSRQENSEERYEELASFALH